MRRAILALILLLPLQALPTEEESIDRGILDEPARGNLELAFGFIVDRTITQFGAEFVRHYSQEWREQMGTEGVDVTIVERPSARWGSIIYVEHDQRPIARVFLYAGRSANIKPLAESAARYVAGRVADDALAGLLLRDPDLGREGL